MVAMTISIITSRLLYTLPVIYTYRLTAPRLGSSSHKQQHFTNIGTIIYSFLVEVKQKNAIKGWARARIIQPTQFLCMAILLEHSLK
jgi:hypothetical protein